MGAATPRHSPPTWMVLGTARVVPRGDTTHITSPMHLTATPDAARPGASERDAQRTKRNAVARHGMARHGDLVLVITSPPPPRRATACIAE